MGVFMRLGRPRPRRAIAAGIGLALLIPLSACGGDASPAASSKGGLEKTKISVRVLPVADVAPIYIAKQKGYFAAEGLDVTLVPVPTAPPAIADMVGGKLDLAFANYVTFFSSQANGLKLRFVSDGYQAKEHVFQVMTTKDSAVKTIPQLAGKTIGTSTLKNIGELTASSVLSANGVDPKSVKFKQVDNDKMASALKAGQIDAGFFLEPFISQAEQKDGLVTLFDAAQGPTADIAIGGYAATAAWAQKNPNTLAAFQRAMAKAQQDAGDRRTLEQVVQTYTKIDAATASVITFGAYPTTLSKTRLQRVVDLMNQFKVLKPGTETKIDLDAMLGTS
jgi:NitT/TauT family transport system substrate-binding protein